MNIIETLEAEQIAKLLENRDVPDFKPGDTLRVHTKVVEGTRERIQVYEGPVHRAPQRGLELVVHRPQDFLRRGRGARLPALFAERGEDRSHPHRQGAPGEALLSARPCAAAPPASPRTRRRCSRRAPAPPRCPPPEPRTPRHRTSAFRVPALPASAGPPREVPAGRGGFGYAARLAPRRVLSGEAQAASPCWGA